MPWARGGALLPTWEEAEEEEEGGGSLPLSPGGAETVGECCMGNQKFPTVTKINLGDEHPCEESLHLYTLVDC